MNDKQPPEVADTELPADPDLVPEPQPDPVQGEDEETAETRQRAVPADSGGPLP